MTAPSFFPRLQRVWEGSFLARPTIVKQRFSKKYRHPLLDAKLTVARLKQVGAGRPACRRRWGPGPQLVAAVGPAAATPAACSQPIGFPRPSSQCHAPSLFCVYGCVSAGSAQHDESAQARSAHARWGANNALLKYIAACDAAKITPPCGRCQYCPCLWPPVPTPALRTRRLPASLSHSSSLPAMPPPPCLLRAVLYHVDHALSCIYMELVEGHSVKALLHQGSLQAAELEGMLAAVGRAVARLHDGGLVHGDLTTSNMMLRQADRQLVSGRAGGRVLVGWAVGL